MSKIFRMIFIFIISFCGVILFGSAIFTIIQGLIQQSMNTSVWTECIILLIAGISMLGLLAEISYLEKRIIKLEEKIDKQNKE